MSDMFHLLRKKPNVEEVQALIDKYPDAVKEKDEVGNLPLHLAAGYGASAEVIQLLIKAYPDAVKEKDAYDGNLPLHWAARIGASAEVIQLLIKAYPDAVKEKDGDGYLALHWATRYGASAEVIQLLIKAYPDAVKEKDEVGNLPLHLAAINGASAEVVQLLIKEYPDAVKEKTEDGNRWLPLHLAAKYGASAEVIQLLIKAYPDAVKETGGNGWLPLHLAARIGASAEVIHLLIKAYPDAVKEKDGIGFLPLQSAARYGASAEVIQLLIKAYPDAVKEKDLDGNLPLIYHGHGMYADNASVEVLQLLIKAYPDGVKETGGNGWLPISSPQIKEIYDSTFVEKLTRSKGLRGDHAKGKDLLGVKEEAHAIADTIAFKDLETPFVVGILGGWGSGKSFTFNLIQERLKEIQGFDLTNNVVKLDFPYVGHIYFIKFDVWTYAKVCLWASLMNHILTELNDQLDLEAAVGFQLLQEGVSVIELMDQFATSGEIKYLKEALKGESVQQAIREWKPRGGNITKALINATNSKYDDEVKELAEKKQELDNFTREFEKEKDKKKQKLAWDDVTAEFNTTFLPEIQNILKDAYKQYAKKNPGDPVPRTVEAAMNSMEQWTGLFGPFLRYCDLLRAGKWSPLWATVFLSSLIIAVVLPVVLDKVGVAFTALGPFLSGIYVRFNDARAKLRSAQAEISKVASEMNLDKEHVQEAMEAANKAQRGSETNDEEKQQDNIATLNAEINTLEDRVWLREGDSLNKVVGDRLGSSNYEEHLGVVHQAQADLKLISDAILRRDGNEEDAAKRIFPRGDPRIVLFIDDLDRCPPKKVVETLEAVQLLVKTNLFVVVLAIDSQYVTLCLEKEYEDILSQERHPSGLDYVEKIVQLPYRVPPISAEYMESYLQEQMNAEEEEEEEGEEEEDDSRDLSASNDEGHVTQEGSSATAIDESESHDDNQSRGQSNAQTPMLPDNMSVGAGFETLNTINAPEEETPLIESAQSESKKSLVEIPTKELNFSWKELQSLKDACVFSGVGPRSGRRLVNVFKLMKIIWYRRDRTPGVSMKEACVLILALGASNSRSVRQEMCKVLAKIEQTTSMPAECDNLKDFIEKALRQVEDAPLTKMNSAKCNRIFEKVKWKDDKEWNLVKNDLRLLRSFSFLGEYNESADDNHREQNTQIVTQEEKLKRTYELLELREMVLKMQEPNLEQGGALHCF